MRKWTGGIVLAVAVVLSGVTCAAAEDHPDRTRVHRHAPLQVTIAPVGRLYRQCVDRPVVEHRATGDTVVPSFSCRWALR